MLVWNNKVILPGCIGLCVPCQSVDAINVDQGDIMRS
jgi:hypothetical protein